MCPSMMIWFICILNAICLQRLLRHGMDYVFSFAGKCLWHIEMAFACDFHIFVRKLLLWRFCDIMTFWLVCSVLIPQFSFLNCYLEFDCVFNNMKFDENDGLRQIQFLLQYAYTLYTLYHKFWHCIIVRTKPWQSTLWQIKGLFRYQQ